MKRSKELNDQRQVTPEPISISLALPLLVAAADESRDELVELWARLLAAAADPDRTRMFRQLFIETAKQLDPIDAALLQWVAANPKPKEINEVLSMDERAREALNLTHDELEVSKTHLANLGLLIPQHQATGLRLTAYAREFNRAVQD